MAAEIQVPWTATGDSLYAIVHDEYGAVCNGSGFESYDASHYPSYAIPLVEIATSRHYVASFPSILSGFYHVSLYRQTGGSPAEGDDPIDHFGIEWLSTHRMLVSEALQGQPDAILDQIDGVESAITLRQALRLILAALAGRISGADTSSVSITDVNAVKTRIVASVDAAGNRTSVTVDPT